MVNPAGDRPSIGVAIASRDRPEALELLIGSLRQQTLPPSRIVVSVVSEDDVPGAARGAADIITGPPGLCAQRNRALTHLETSMDVIVFFDDDFVPSRRSLEGVSRLFSGARDIAGATGLVLADGVTRGSIGFADAVKIVAAYDERPAGPTEIFDVPSLYGCNMAFRSAAAAGIRFDEALARYGWQEDVDFSGALAARGRLVRSNAFAGVHRGVTSGRTPGVPLGYSQMVNPRYLVQKGTVTRGHALKQMARNFLANHAKVLWPEPHIDRLGRVRGNWRGLFDMLAGSADPRKILDL